jgi:TPP-dependent pyruvate/acetoin dehydrogenase alpha subunit
MASSYSSVVKNNLYGMLTPAENVCSSTAYYKRGLNIPGIQVTDKDLNTLINVYEYAKTNALAHGPIIIQILIGHVGIPVSIL